LPTISVNERGRLAFLAYKNWQQAKGNELPNWEALPLHIRQAWITDTDNLRPWKAEGRPCRTKAKRPSYSRRSAKPGFVYFIRADDGLVKIGIAKDPASRLRNMQTGSAAVLRIIAVHACDSPAAVEAGLHRQFAHLRQHGEWFSPTPELLMFIASLDQ
jgi:hypothetical protein